MSLLLLAGVGVPSLIPLLITLIIFCVVCWLAYYIIQNLAPAPMQHILTAVLVVVAVLVILYYLAGFAGVR